MGRIADTLKGAGLVFDQQQRREVATLDDEFLQMKKEIQSLKTKNLHLQSQVKPLERENQRLKDELQKQKTPNQTISDLQENLLLIVFKNTDVETDALAYACKMEIETLKYHLEELRALGSIFLSPALTDSRNFSKRDFGKPSSGVMRVPELQEHAQHFLDLSKELAEFTFQHLAPTALQEKSA